MGTLRIELTPEQTEAIRKVLGGKSTGEIESTKIFTIAPTHEIVILELTFIKMKGKE